MMNTPSRYRGEEGLHAVAIAAMVAVEKIAVLNGQLSGKQSQHMHHGVNSYYYETMTLSLSNLMKANPRSWRSRRTMKTTSTWR